MSLKVSIITVTYNAEKFLEDCLRSVTNQTYPNLEYIVIDGLSNDNTLKIISYYKEEISHLVSEKDNGMYDALNKGIRLATGDVIGIVNADDFLASPDIVSKIAAAFETSGADVLYGNLDYVDQQDTGKVLRKWRSKPYRDGMFQFGWMPAHPTFYAKRDLFSRYGSYKPVYGSAADYELMIRFVHKHKAKTVFLPEVMIKMRVGGMSNSSVKNRLLANQADMAAMKANGISFPLLTAIMKPLRKLPQFFGL
ncbi:MAG: glycosyltransferase [Sphingobacteriaceae bacterium]|jgi:glycosyltransferase|nr:glycosyltransferase [Sphingobacteriaceae bacterium]